MRDAGCGMQDSGFGIRDAGCGIQDSGCGIEDEGSGTRDSEAEPFTAEEPLSAEECMLRLGLVRIVRV
jgi:hypothetical protein